MGRPGSTSLRVRPGVRDVLESLTRPLEAEIHSCSERLERDVELRQLAWRVGDRDAVAALEFRMRETYAELLPRVVVRGLIGLLPHLLALCLLYWLLPTVSVLGLTVSTVSAYILVGVLLLLGRHGRAWHGRRRAAREPDPVSRQQ